MTRSTDVAPPIGRSGGDRSADLVATVLSTSRRRNMQEASIATDGRVLGDIAA